MSRATGRRRPGSPPRLRRSAIAHFSSPTTTTASTREALAQLDAPDRDAALGKALRDAARVPLQIAETAADVAALAALAAREGAEAVRGDAWTAAVLAEAASTAAAGLVRVNLATRPDDDLRTRAEAAARAAVAARDVALATK